LRWRVQLTSLYAAGLIPDIDLPHLIEYMAPGSDQDMNRLLATRNPYAVIRNPRLLPEDERSGGERFRQTCASCHGIGGGGAGGGPSLVGRVYRQGDSDWALYRAIRFGVPGTSMSAHEMSDSAIWQLVTHVRSLSGPSLTPEVDRRQTVSVPFEEIAATKYPGRDWLTYSGSYSSARHSLLRQINTTNVSKLAMRWIHHFDGNVGLVETSPIVRDGVMFVTVPPGSVRALDASTGRTIWERKHVIDPELAQAVGVMRNRGVAILNDMVYVGTSDAKLVALDATTGAVRWSTNVSDDPRVYFITGAPLALKDLVITGVGTRQIGRGFVAAFDAKTGKERWRFTTIPGPGEPGHDTWSGDSWTRGGAPTWLTGSYDPALDLLLWPVGNPKPDYEPHKRRGDNLYSNSIVALRAETGKLVWHFQFTPNDDHDWDANQISILAEFETHGKIEKRVMIANRNGFFYILDRLTGRFISASPFVHQTWTAGMDSAGRPLPLPDSQRSAKGLVIYPGNVGGTNWWSPSYDPALQRVFVPSLEQGMVYFSSESSWPTASPAMKFYTSVRNLDARTGKRMWEYRQPDRTADNTMGGLLSTAGSVLFGGDETRFFAVDSRSGRPLWTVETGGEVHAPPVTFEVQSEQFVVIAAGQNLLAFALPSRRPVPTH
jgi:alcohol dehydrogenase (cytochrome c)